MGLTPEKRMEKFKKVDLIENELKLEEHKPLACSQIQEEDDDEGNSEDEFDSRNLHGKNKYNHKYNNYYYEEDDLENPRVYGHR